MALVHCRECGEMISEFAPSCPKCGASQNLSSAHTVVKDKAPSVILNILSFLFYNPIGWILYLVYKDSSPRRAKSCGKWTIIGLLVSIIIGVILSILLIWLMV